MARKNPNVFVKQFSLIAEWLEDGDKCKMEVDFSGDSESIHKLVAVIADSLSNMFGNE